MFLKRRIPVLWGSLAAVFLWTAHSAATEPVHLDEVVVIAPESGRFLQVPGMETRVISAAEIEELQVRTVPELLETLSSVTLTERGTPGSQADLSMRGSSVEGVLLLIDGIRMQDPQTGHFLLDLPLDLGSVERVEVLSGGGSTFYGSSASGGIVNIVTRAGEGGGNGGVSVGSFGGRHIDGTLSALSGNAGITAGIRLGRSDGDAEGTDLEYTGADASGTWGGDQWNIRWNAGIGEKRFGARGFYGDYPSFEEVMTVQAGIHAVRTLDERSALRFRLGGRGHGDRFTLVRTNPDIYRNTHYNRGFTGSAEYSRILGNGGSLALGTEAERIGITSGKLGNRADANAALYGAFSGRFLGSGYSMSFRFDRGYNDERVLSPGLGIEIPLSGLTRLHLRAERSFRAPTYTERYYNDPANRGNSDLRAEYSTNAEAGLHRNSARSALGATVFAHRTTRVIDWVRDPGETTWQAVNHGRLLTAGTELAGAVGLIRDWRFRGSVTILRQRVHGRQGRESKYALNPSEETVAASLSGSLIAGLWTTLGVRHERMRSGDIRTPLDLRLSRRIGAVNILGSVRNAGNERYEEIPGLRVPGRCFSLEMEYVR